MKLNYHQQIASGILVALFSMADMVLVSLFGSWILLLMSFIMFFVVIFILGVLES